MSGVPNLVAMSNAGWLLAWVLVLACVVIALLLTEDD